MPECPSKYRLVRFESGLLAPAERSEVEHHMTTCTSCREALGGIRATCSEFDVRYDDHLEALRTRMSQGAANNVISLKSHRRRGLVVGIATAALAAAAAAIFVLLPASSQMGPLPGYELDSNAGEQLVRGEDDEVQTLRLAPGTRIELIARPTATMEGAFEARAFALTGGGSAFALSDLIRKDTSGAVIFSGIVGEDLSLPDGTRSIWIAIARPGKLPDASDLPALVRTGSKSEHTDIILLGKDVELVSE